MASGLAALLDDIAALAKLAASSIDDVGAAAGRASAKAAGVVVDDAAVTPAYVRGLAANRELLIIRKIATGSLRNKIAVHPARGADPQCVAPVLVEIILMVGGTYLCFEGAEKVHHLRRQPRGRRGGRTAGSRAGSRSRGQDHHRRDPHRLHPLRRNHGDLAQRGP